MSREIRRPVVLSAIQFPYRVLKFAVTDGSAWIFNQIDHAQKHGTLPPQKRNLPPRVHYYPQYEAGGFIGFLLRCQREGLFRPKKPYPPEQVKHFTFKGFTGRRNLPVLENA